MSDSPSNVGIKNSSGVRIDPATAAKQDTGNTSLASIVTNTGASKLGTPGSGITSGTAAAIGSSLACKSVLLTNTHASLSLLFGNSLAQLTPLLAGASVSLPATNVTEIFVKNGSGAATFAYQPVIAG